MSFAEASDEHDHVTLESTSSVSAITDGYEVTWHFRVNPTWDDTEAVRVYAGLTTANNINGLPDAVLSHPVVKRLVAARRLSASQHKPKRAAKAKPSAESTSAPASKKRSRR